MNNILHPTKNGKKIHRTDRDNMKKSLRIAINENSQNTSLSPNKYNELKIYLAPSPRRRKT